jgi:hypothetical protein
MCETLFGLYAIIILLNLKHCYNLDENETFAKIKYIFLFELLLVIWDIFQFLDYIKTKD